MKVILSAGHRNTDGGGATRESEHTYPACVAVRDELKRRGHDAWIIQEHDGDSRPDTSLGRGLQNVARLCVDLAKTVGGVDLYLSLHYEGTGTVPGPVGCFGIYPDGNNDTADMNPLDIRVAKAIAEAVSKTGIGLRGNGIMSERNTYVGSQGYRLGEMVGTIGFRDRTARVIFEAGNYSHPGNRALMWEDHWRNVLYPRAIVDGLESVFGKIDGIPSIPVPTPTPESPKPGYAKPIEIDAVKKDRPLVVLDNGAVLVRLHDATAKTKKQTPRLQAAHAGSAKIGPDIPSGESFMVDYLIINPDSSLYLLTPYWTRVRWADCSLLG